MYQAALYEGLFEDNIYIAGLLGYMHNKEYEEIYEETDKLGCVWSYDMRTRVIAWMYAGQAYVGHMVKYL